MGLIDKLGGLQNTRQKSKNSDKSINEIITESISVQMDIQNGNSPKNDKGNPIKSWFRNGQMTPVISNLSFFGNTPSLDIGNMNPMDVLKEFEKEFNNGDYKSYVDDLQNRMNERMVALRNARSKRK